MLLHVKLWINCHFDTPIELTASMGSESIVSIASYCSFATKPTVYIIIASTPANGPKPTIITNNKAHKIDGNVRIAANNARIGA